jgi:hypothetical protein
MNKIIENFNKNFCICVIYKKLLSIFCFLMLLSCQQKIDNKFAIKGIFKNATHLKVSLFTFDKDSLAIVLDTTTIDNKGNFKLNGIGTKEELYAIKIGNAMPIWIVNDSKLITISGNYLQYNTYQIANSPTSVAIPPAP